MVKCKFNKLTYMVYGVKQFFLLILDKKLAIDVTCPTWIVQFEVVNS